jgi:hypothetical protein
MWCAAPLSPDHFRGALTILVNHIRARKRSKRPQNGQNAAKSASYPRFRVVFDLNDEQTDDCVKIKAGNNDNK